MSKSETADIGKLAGWSFFRLDGGTALMTVLIGFMGFYVLYPLILIVINSFNTATIAEPEVYGLGAWRAAFQEPGIWRSLWNSVKIGIVLQIIALPSGIFISWLLARTNIPFANGFEFCFWISFITAPPADARMRARFSSAKPRLFSRRSFVPWKRGIT